MNSLMIFPYYLHWHYARGSRALIEIVENIILFEFHYFSVMELLKNLFAPYQRLKEHHQGSVLHFESFFSTLLINLIMRIIGLIIRLSILCVATIVMLITLSLVPVIMAIWLALPMVIVCAIGLSIWSLSN